MSAARPSRAGLDLTATTSLMTCRAIVSVPSRLPAGDGGSGTAMSEPFTEPTHDTSADRMVETSGSLRDDDPEVMPMDRGAQATDRPLAAEKFGTTAAEAREGESLDDKLAEEVPEQG